HSAFPHDRLRLGAHRHPTDDLVRIGRIHSRDAPIIVTIRLSQPCDGSNHYSERTTALFVHLIEDVRAETFDPSKGARAERSARIEIAPNGPMVGIVEREGDLIRR